MVPEDYFLRSQMVLQIAHVLRDFTGIFVKTIPAQQHHVKMELHVV